MGKCAFTEPDLVRRSVMYDLVNPVSLVPNLH